MPQQLRTRCDVPSRAVGTQKDEGVALTAFAAQRKCRAVFGADPAKSSQLSKVARADVR
jgi:hypothetical protein